MNTLHALTRRRLIKHACTGALLSVLPLSVRASKSNATGQTGLQLYTLRDWMAVSVPGTLKLVAGVGYQEVEFAGYYGVPAREVRKILDGEGLRAPSAHFTLQAFRDSVDQVIDTALEIGHKFVGLAYLPPHQRGTSIAHYQALAQELNQWGEVCKEQGITMAYHNHDFEFTKINAVVPYDVLLQQTDPTYVTMELDLYWMFKAQRYPLAYFEKYPGRFKLWHVKDMDATGSFAPVGAGVIDFNAVFSCAEMAGVEHYFVELDHTQEKLEAISVSYHALLRLLQTHIF